ncbi:helix-turn-helix transcriptional regulator [Oscillospiraceae bacterium OttesenSCG-928-G22]|nr:helix-turn-helix transcriptional regulator [Oscillospiraceae bacterium OttesenSCG-928-G22]
MDILQRITQLREERGWSKRKLALMSDLPQTTISNLYNRSYEPTISTLESICAGFGIPLAEFFNIDNESVILTSEQKELLLQWSLLNHEQKESLFALMKNMK